jgi:5' nucleotidase family
MMKTRHPRGDGAVGAMVFLTSLIWQCSRVRAFSIQKGVSCVSSSRRLVSLNVAEKSTAFETTTFTELNGATGTSFTNTNSNTSRFGDLLAAADLQGHLKHVPDLSQVRTVTPNDVFCNRELKMSHIRAIGFDMDYTLAQYQQPAFDQLAFDGAKAKLVEKLGYPSEVLDFQYDHEVCTRNHEYRFFLIFNVNISLPSFLS